MAYNMFWYQLLLKNSSIIFFESNHVIETITIVAPF